MFSGIGIYCKYLGVPYSGNLNYNPEQQPSKAQESETPNFDLAGFRRTTLCSLFLDLFHKGSIEIKGCFKFNSVGLVASLRVGFGSIWAQCGLPGIGVSNRVLDS